MDMNLLQAFLRESLKIEGIHREPTQAELAATAAFLELPVLRLSDVQGLVEVYAPGKILRQHAGMNVRVGRYTPPPGGPELAGCLMTLLDEINNGELTPYEAHVRYEMLHAFMDGNGRSGRTIWLWQMNGSAPLGFLHTYYYQSLDAADERKL